MNHHIFKKWFKSDLAVKRFVNKMIKNGYIIKGVLKPNVNGLIILVINTFNYTVKQF